MFFARCIGVSLSVFLLLYATLSVVVIRGWKVSRWVSQWLSARQSARLLFAMRVLPLAGAAVVTLAVAVPSFLLLEPRQVDEEIGIVPLLLTLACLALLTWGVRRAVAAQRQTAIALARWLSGAAALPCKTDVPIFRTGKDSPTLAVTGVYAPLVLVSETTIDILNEAELESALRHEMAHVRSRDNLKKLFFRFAAFPGMEPLERAWSEDAEMAADADAVSSMRDALDLAAALIKLSRLAPVQQPAAALATGLLHGPDALTARVDRLFAWHQPHSRTMNPWWYVAPAGVSIMLLVSNYGALLTAMHSVTEWLVR
jgi:Zn-dependent protease with chaperone function